MNLPAGITFTTHLGGERGRPGFDVAGRELAATAWDFDLTKMRAVYRRRPGPHGHLRNQPSLRHSDGAVRSES